MPYVRSRSSLAFGDGRLYNPLMDRRCAKCSARCCRYFSLPIGQPETYEDFEQVRWYLLHRGIAVYIDTEGDWYMLVRNLCRNLRKVAGESRDRPRSQTAKVGPVPVFECKDYENRPIICREFSPKSCDFTRGSHAVEEFFDTAADLEAYARRMLGDWVFDKERGKVSRATKHRLKGGSRRDS